MPPQPLPPSPSPIDYSRWWPHPPPPPPPSPPALPSTNEQLGTNSNLVGALNLVAGLSFVTAVLISCWARRRTDRRIADKANQSTLATASTQEEPSAEALTACEDYGRLHFDSGNYFGTTASASNGELLDDDEVTLILLGCEDDEIPTVEASRLSKPHPLRPILEKKGDPGKPARKNQGDDDIRTNLVIAGDSGERAGAQLPIKFVWGGKVQMGTLNLKREITHYAVQELVQHLAVQGSRILQLKITPTMMRIDAKRRTKGGSMARLPLTPRTKKSELKRIEALLVTEWPDDEQPATADPPSTQPDPSFAKTENGSPENGTIASQQRPLEAVTDLQIGRDPSRSFEDLSKASSQTSTSEPGQAETEESMCERADTVVELQKRGDAARNQKLCGVCQKLIPPNLVIFLPCMHAMCMPCAESPVGKVVQLCDITSRPELNGMQFNVTRAVAGDRFDVDVHGKTLCVKRDKMRVAEPLRCPHPGCFVTVDDRYIRRWCDALAKKVRGEALVVSV